MLVDDIRDAFRKRSDEQGVGYQTLIDLAPRKHLGRRPVDEDTLRWILREERNPAA